MPDDPLGIPADSDPESSPQKDDQIPPAETLDEVPEAPKRRGGQLGNVNRLRHGTKRKFPNVRQPKNHRGMEKYLQNVRLYLEKSVTKSHGSKITVSQELDIQAAVHFEGEYRTHARMMRENDATLKVDDRLKILSAMGKAVDRRQKYVDRLKIDPSQKSAMEQIWHDEPEGDE